MRRRFIHVEKKGLEICRSYYFLYGEKMLEEMFRDAVSSLAIGLCGSGSECFGFDDLISRDHDFDPGFMIFLPDEEVLDRKTAFRIERAYDSLPRNYSGLEKRASSLAAGRRGITRLSEFLSFRIGSVGVPDNMTWLKIPENYLAETVNGELFRDDSGIFTDIRRRISAPPKDVVLKKLAGCLFIMSQAGVYNFRRCIARGDTGAAQLCCYEFARNASNAFFWLNGRYMPFYKWAFRAMRELPGGDSFADFISGIISRGNDCPDEKKEAIDSVCRIVFGMLKDLGITDGAERSVIDTAYFLNEKTADPVLRNLHILYGVN